MHSASCLCKKQPVLWKVVYCYYPILVQVVLINASKWCQFWSYSHFLPVLLILPVVLRNTVKEQEVELYGLAGVGRLKSERLQFFKFAIHYEYSTQNFVTRSVFCLCHNLNPVPLDHQANHYHHTNWQEQTKLCITSPFYLSFPVVNCVMIWVIFTHLFIFGESSLNQLIKLNPLQVLPTR
jgi:hypothetical protein